jgi:hypothetical protein
MRLAGDSALKAQRRRMDVGNAELAGKTGLSSGSAHVELADGYGRATRVVGGCASFRRGGDA